MDNSKEIACLYDSWFNGLTAEEKKVCQVALRRIIFNFRNIGEVSAKELLVAILLHYDPKKPK